MLYTSDFMRVRKKVSEHVRGAGELSQQPFNWSTTPYHLSYSIPKIPLYSLTIQFTIYLPYIP